MTHKDRATLPHAIYRLFDIKDKLLYIGMSQNPFATRLQSHGTKSWARDIATARIEWFPDWHTARKAEASALLDENPLHNYDKTTVLLTQSGRRPRGYGITCPICSGSKDSYQTYCKPCGAAYRRSRRLKRVAEA